ncbi:MAG: hypothetical protein KDK66_01365 [Deltaproteobacteria bacterium]|nr:hypothetical protein [Deltaproteobacteria bacterium]
MVILRLREKDYLKKKTKEAMSQEMKFEIDREKTEWQKRHHRFENFLDQEIKREKPSAESSPDSKKDFI